MKVLVCGGAGYIGSHIMMLVLDDADIESAVAGRVCYEQDLRDVNAVHALFEDESFDAIMHFCARSLVEESIADAHGYYTNNRKQRRRLHPQPVGCYETERRIHADIFIDMRRIRRAHHGKNRWKSSETTNHALRR